ncbi:hypothetical protein JTB14_000967 [Gonioctena quinquepunctata]|nr:hypothetical protein JTB14_000967 [Gonioctena quinquepunctata]
MYAFSQPNFRPPSIIDNITFNPQPYALSTPKAEIKQIFEYETFDMLEKLKGPIDFDKTSITAVIPTGQIVIDRIPGLWKIVGVETAKIRVRYRLLRDVAEIRSSDNGGGCADAL